MPANPTALIDLTGKRFGLLTVIGRGPNSKKQLRWHCRCKCGGEKLAFGSALRGGSANNCGCLTASRISAKKTQHGHAPCDGKSPEYLAWSAMLRRCTNARQSNFKYYGGRGITICDRWRTFANFLADLGPMPVEGGPWTVDRIDNNGDYKPSNCRWALRSTQANNKRSNRTLTHSNRTQTIALWSREIGLSVGTILGRLKRGWSHERTLTEKPIRGRNQSPR